MSQVEITFEISEIIAARIATFPRGVFAVPECGALPLFADLGGIVGIRPDGTLVEWSHHGRGRDARPVRDRVRVLIALAAAAGPYPELQHLLPARGPGSVHCECRRIPESVSGLVDCGRCGRMGWLSKGEDSRPHVRTVRPRRSFSVIGLVLVALAIASFYGAFVILAGPPRGYFLNGLTLIALGMLSLVLAFRGFGSRPPRRRRIAQGPTFAADDPEVATLPPTSLTHASERVRMAREQRERAQE